MRKPDCASRTSASASLPLAPDARSSAVAVFTSGLVDMPVANDTGAVSRRPLPAPLATNAPVAPNASCPALPVTVPHDDVPLAVHVTVPVRVTSAGSASAIVTFTASLTPPLVTVTRYVPVPPGVYVAMPSVMMTARLTEADSASLSAALAAAPVALSSALTVLTRGFAVSVAANATGTTKVSVLPAPAPIVAPVAEKEPCPALAATVPQLASPFAVQLTSAASVTPLGSVSAIATSAASEGPSLPATIV